MLLPKWSFVTSRYFSNYNVAIEKEEKTEKKNEKKGKKENDFTSTLLN